MTPAASESDGRHLAGRVSAGGAPTVIPRAVLEVVAFVLAFVLLPMAALAQPHGAFSSSTSKCTACHVPHAAVGDSILGSSTADSLCYSCHDGTGSIYDTLRSFGTTDTPAASKHPVGTSLECDSCHTPHKGPAEGNVRSLSAGPSHASTGTAVCGACHGAGSSLPGGNIVGTIGSTSHATSMTAPPSGTQITCLGCHAPHGSTNPSLLATQVVSIGGTGRSVSLDGSSGNALLCTACHDVAQGGYGGPAAYSAGRHGTVTMSSVATVTYPGVPGLKANDCENCHAPHGSGNPALVRDSGNGTCFACHDAAGTTKPAGYSYRGESAYTASAHASLATTAPGGTGCGVCHAVHGGGEASWNGSTPAGALGSPESKLCTGSGAGGCHSSSAASVGGVNVLGSFTASSNDSSHHDVMPSAQQATGARITCSDCHDPHRETIASKFSDPSDISTGIAGDTARFVNASGQVFVMVAAEHDGVAPIISGLSVDTNAGATSPVVTWTTNEAATTWLDWGTTTGYELGSVGTTLPLTTSHSVAPTGVTAGMTYHYRVRSADALGNERVSLDHTYTAVSIGTPILTYPDATTTIWWYYPPTPVDFRWTQVSVGADAIAYDVVIRWSNGSVYKQVDHCAPANATAPSWHDPSFPNASGTFTWTVRAYDVATGVTGPWASPVTFSADFDAMGMLPMGASDMLASVAEGGLHTLDRSTPGVQVAVAEPSDDRTMFSVDTDHVAVQVRSRVAAPVDNAPAAGWESVASVSGTPTPVSPGISLGSGRLSAANALDGTYLTTDLATADHDVNRQVFRFDLGARGAAAASEILLDWTGHGEPTVGYRASVYLWDVIAGSWVTVTTRDALGADARVIKGAASVPDTFCLRCHSGSTPLGVVMPSGLTTIGPIWGTGSTSDFHGPRVGTGSAVSNGTLLPGAARGGQAACATCHDPHGSSSRYAFPRFVNGVDTSGTAGSNTSAALCNGCHAGGLSQWHAGCATECHNAGFHGGDLSGFLPAQSSDCLGCHKHGTSWTHVTCLVCHSEGELQSLGAGGAPYGTRVYSTF